MMIVSVLQSSLDCLFIAFNTVITTLMAFDTVITTLMAFDTVITTLITFNMLMTLIAFITTLTIPIVAAHVPSAHKTGTSSVQMSFHIRNILQSPYDGAQSPFPQFTQPSRHTGFVIHCEGSLTHSSLLHR